jgi:tetraacyldisaccharide 4'-kinase
VRSAWFDIVSGARRGARAAAARAALGALSFPYAAAVRGRRWLYRRGVFRSRRAPVPVISVGNITVGGTGKTPFVEYLVKGLRERGRRPAVVMRGYGRRRGEPSDEAALLAVNLGRDVPVIEDPDRLRGCEAARGRGADVAVLDDGFQHVRLERDLDVVVLDATSPFGFGRLFPAGCLREAPESLARADVIVISRADLPGPAELDAIRARASELAPDAFVIEGVHMPTRLETVKGVEGPAFERVFSGPVAAFAGVGNPYAFGMTLRRLGAKLVLSKRFADHHRYRPAELACLAEEAEARGAGFVLTTQKDAVRLGGDDWPVTAPPLYVLRAEFELRGDDRVFWELVARALEREAEGAGPGEEREG